MTKTTAEMWPDETPDEMLARVRREHGDAIADLVARDLTVVPKRRKKVKEIVGNKPRTPPAPSGVPPQFPEWSQNLPELDFLRNGKRLPRSGAGAVVRVVPRAHKRRSGLNDSP